MIITTARIRLPGASTLLVIFNFLLALGGIVLVVLGMGGVEKHIRVETSLISKGPLVGLCIFIIVIDLMYMFTKFHLGKNIDKPLTVFLIVLKYASGIFLLLALIRIASLKTVINVTEETVCKHGAEYGTYFFRFPVNLRDLGLDIYNMRGPNGVMYECESMTNTLPSLTLATLGAGIALFAQVNFMMITTFGYRQFKKDDIIVAPKKSSGRPKVKMVTKNDRLNDNSRMRSRSSSRRKSTKSDTSRMSRSKRTNHRRNKNKNPYSDSSFGNRLTTFKRRSDDISLDDISLSDIDRYV